MKKADKGIVRMASDMAQNDRMWRFQQLLQDGHVEIVYDMNPSAVTVQIGDEKFREVRECFPTTVLMARLALAIAAGQSNRDRVRVPYAPFPGHMHGNPYTVRHRPQGYQGEDFWVDEAVDTRRIGVTATVKTKRSGAKGLR